MLKLVIIIFQNDLYGGTRNFIQTEFDKFGIQYSFTKGLDPEDFSAQIKNTVGIYVELKVIHLK